MRRASRHYHERVFGVGDVEQRFRWFFGLWFERLGEQRGRGQVVLVVVGLFENGLFATGPVV